MTELARAAEAAFSPSAYRCILSQPRGEELLRAEVHRREAFYQVERHTADKVTHQNLSYERARDEVLRMLEQDFFQLHAFDDTTERAVRVTKKGRILTRSAPHQPPSQQQEGHNRAKKAILQEGIAVPALVDMGVLTQEGRVRQPMYDKYRQINRFLEIVEDAVGDLPPGTPFSVIDFGCGKSYLTFLLYHYLTELRGLKADILGLDLKADVIRDCAAAAQRYGYTGLRFEVGDINGYDYRGRPDLVVTLHACDTATDHAIFNALRWGAERILSVPCCQHELNGQIKSEGLSILTRYGLVRERVAALMTDALRGNLLEVCGYKTQLLEFIELEHTPKNILIRAVKRHRPPEVRQKALREVEALLAEFSLTPTLYTLLKDSGQLELDNGQ